MIDYRKLWILLQEYLEQAARQVSPPKADTLNQVLAEMQRLERTDEEELTPP